MSEFSVSMSAEIEFRKVAVEFAKEFIEKFPRAENLVLWYFRVVKQGLGFRKANMPTPSRNCSV